MARIRSIKPEFWTDGTNLELTDSCALFFIGLWNFCDDEGKHPLNLNQLVAQLGGRWHRGKVELFLSCLIKSGQLRLNSDSTWIQVTGWSHQKIDKPKQPETKAADLQWLSQVDSWKLREQSRPIDARIGSDRRDRIGSDHTPKKESSAKPKTAALATRPLASPIGQNLGAIFIDSYRDRYGHGPTLMPKDFKLLKSLGEAQGLAGATELIRAYLKMNNSWFVTKLHDVPTLIANLNAVQNFIATGMIVTATDARNAEADSAFQNQFLRLGVGQ